MSRVDGELRMNQRTVQLAKRQRTWFRHQLQSTPFAADAVPAEELAARVSRVLDG
jgi:tRNA A37 N6-isopentenylltransferase MiaA